MYNTKFLLEALDSLIESATYKLNEQELELLEDIRSHIADTKDEAKIEKGFFELVKWLILIKEYLDNIS